MTPSGQIHLYGVIQAFRQGRMPDNKQIDETLQYFLNHSIVDTSKLSSEGKHLVNVPPSSAAPAFPFPVPASIESTLAQLPVFWLFPSQSF
jgi:hypothetical protein